MTDDKIAKAVERLGVESCLHAHHALAAVFVAAARYARLLTQPGEDSNEAFERVAAWFRAETGYLRPGKDCRIHDPEVRREAYRAWCDKIVADFHAALQRAAEKVLA